MPDFPDLEFPRDFYPHRDAEIEWWYLFAFLEERYTFMACVWRYRDSPESDGMMITWSLTEVSGPHRYQATLVDAALVRSMRARVSSYLGQRSDPVLEAILEMTGDGRVFAPYRMAESSACHSSSERPLEAHVGPCRLDHDSVRQSLHLHIEDQALTLDAVVDLAGDSFPMGGRGTFWIEGREMHGYTHPRAPTTVSLKIGGIDQRLAGTTWFDHQWGEWYFEKPLERYYHPEWQYFAALLDDGRSLNVYRPTRPGAGGQEPAPMDALSVVLRLPDGTIECAEYAQVVARDRIESLRTHNSYEYGWSIGIPALRGRLEFVPFHPDHEVFVFTQAWGILELGCRIHGTLQDTDCSGVGFVEAFGASVDINDFFWGQRKTHLAERLEEFLPRRFDASWLQRICNAGHALTIDETAVERALIGPIWSMMDRGGKGWRSAWLTTCCHALGGDGWEEPARHFLPVIELLHTGSLVIDDIQDGSSLRRGEPTLHLQVGTPLAINVGNLLYFLPLLLVQEAHWLTEAGRARIYDIILGAMRQGHVGQAMDLMLSGDRYDVEGKSGAFERTRNELLEQYGLKSGCQLEAIARVAGVLTDSPASAVEPLAAYSRSFGVAFQIVDDIIDLQEGRERLGKSPAEDLANGKLNLLLLHALAGAGDDDRRHLLDVFGSRRETDLAASIREMVHRVGAVERCLKDAEQLMEAAWKEMANLPPSDAKIVMRAVPRWLIRQRRLRALAIYGSP